MEASDLGRAMRSKMQFYDLHRACRAGDLDEVRQHVVDASAGVGLSHVFGQILMRRFVLGGREGSLVCRCLERPRALSLSLQE